MDDYIHELTYSHLHGLCDCKKPTAREEILECIRKIEAFCEHANGSSMSELPEWQRIKYYLDEWL